VNTARAEVLDWDAVTHFVRDRGLRLATDVFPQEPEGGRGTYTHELLGLAGVWGTPHIGASTAQAQLAIAAETVRIVRTFLLTGEAPNCVNVLAQAPARAQVVVRHRDRVGVLASVLGVLKRHGINVGEMTNTLFAGGAAASAKIRLATSPGDACMAELTSLEDVLQVERIELG
jgi:D-3-phosphoglycerate dehydrogenase